MQAFGREGRGVFPSPTVVEDEVVAQYGVEVLGRSDEMVDTFYAISGGAAHHAPGRGGHHQRGARQAVRGLVIAGGSS